MKGKAAVAESVSQRSHTGGSGLPDLAKHRLGDSSGPWDVIIPSLHFNDSLVVIPVGIADLQKHIVKCFSTVVVGVVIASESYNRMVDVQVLPLNELITHCSTFSTPMSFVSKAMWHLSTSCFAAGQLWVVTTAIQP